MTSLASDRESAGAGSLQRRAKETRMEEKVTSWLKKVFGEQPIPLFEVNAQTVDILYELAECNESRDRDVNLLSKDTMSYLNSLVDIALVLETKDTSLASFIPAINDLTSDLSRAQSKNKELELELNTLRKKLTSALVLEKRLQE
ncbi:HAUS augmin-like complex subunit 1, partial [Ophiophagus hannah]